MKKIVIDGSKIADKGALFASLKEQISLEEFTGSNLDALYDVLTSLKEPVELEIQERESLESKIGAGYVKRLVRVFEEQDREL